MKKKWVILFVSLVIIAGGIVAYLKFQGSTDFEPLIKEKLQELVTEGSDSLYSLDIDRIVVDVVGSKITVVNASLNIDSARLAQLDSRQQAPDNVYKVSFKDLVIDGIGAADFIQEKNIDLNSLYLKEPVVEIFHHKRAYNYTPPDTTSLYKKIAAEVGHFSLNNLLVQDIDFRYHNVTKENKLTQLKNLSFNFKNILIDSTTQDDSTRFLYAKDAAIFLKDYNLPTPDSLYNFHIDSFLLNASSRVLTLSGLSVKPRGKKEDFSSKLKFYKDRYDVTIQSATLQNIDWWQLLSEDGFTAHHAKLENGNVEVFADRTLPDPHKYKIGNYPHQLLMRLKLPVHIDKMDIRNFKVSYNELNEKTRQKGSVIFDDISGAFTNITNQPEIIARDKYFTLDATAKLMSKGPLHALFKFDLADAEKGTFSLDIEVGNMDGRSLNIATKPLGLFEIKSAEIQKITARINANNNSSAGAVTFYYKDLNVEVLKKEEDEAGLKKKGLISFIANAFIIEKSNTATDKNKDPKKVTYKRDPYKSFFNLIWKTIFTGLGNTVKGDNG